MVPAVGLAVMTHRFQSASSVTTSRWLSVDACDAAASSACRDRTAEWPTAAAPWASSVQWRGDTRHQFACVGSHRGMAS